MFQQNVSFGERAKFLCLNVCEFPRGLTVKSIEHADAELIIDGLNELRQLLIKIYADTSTYQVADPLDSYHNLTNTILFLYAISRCGELACEGENCHIHIDKKIFKMNFKKSPAFQFETIWKYGFYFEYFKGKSEVDTYKACDAFHMHYENTNSLAPTLKYLHEKSPIMDSKEDYASTVDLFAKADYSSILLHTSTKRQDIDPLRQDIMNTVCSYSGLWIEFVNRMIKKHNLKSKCNYWSYCSPQWMIQFMNKSKPVCFLSLTSSSFLYEMALPFDKADGIAAARNDMPQSIRQIIEKLGCIKCGKCDGSNLVDFDGIKFCPLEGWARRFYVDIKSQDEIDAISTILQIVQK